MKLHKFSKDFTRTETGQAFAAAIELRVEGARLAGIGQSLTPPTVSSTAPQMAGRAA